MKNRISHIRQVPDSIATNSLNVDYVNNICRDIDNDNKKTITLRESLSEKLSEEQECSFNIKERADIPCIVNGENQPYNQAEGLKIEYPQNIKDALAILYKEYSNSFGKLIKSSKEGENSYQYCYDKNGEPMIPFIQIDMPFLPQSFLDEIKDEEPKILANILYPFIFEFEASIARYNLLLKINQEGDEETNFSIGFRENLDNIRKHTGKKIIILSTSTNKLESIKKEEFGISENSKIEPSIIKERSGFDNLWGPVELKKYYENLEEGQESEYVFFTRASIDASQLKTKGENTLEEESILKNDELRNFIKDNTITVNIDNPNDENITPVNDTKDYMENIGLGYFFHNLEDIFSAEATEYLKKGKGFENFRGVYYTEKLKIYLTSIGAKEEDINSGNIHFRCKPVHESYGAYGHVNGKFTDGKSRNNLKKQIKTGDIKYVLQIERPSVKITNSSNGEKYNAIHRVFMNINPLNGKPQFMEGYINAIPTSNSEAIKNNIHGNKSAIWGKVY